MIEKLTPEQTALLPSFRSEWFRWGTCTDRADRSKAEAAILAMRAEIGVTNRPIVLWGRSPLECLLILAIIKSKSWQDMCGKLRDQLGSQLDSQLGSQLKDQLRDQLWDQLRDQLRSQLGSQLGAQLRSQLKDQLRDQLWDQLGDQLRSQLGSQLGDQLGSELGNEWWGQHEAYWISFYTFCREIVGAKYDEVSDRRLNMWLDISQSCCWWWCYENYVVISDRPTVCRMTEQEGRLHCPDGPALAFADGYSLWRWHGVAVPEDVILHPEQIAVSRIDSEGNAEVRRVLMERYGEARYLQDSGAKPIHCDKYGVLYRKEIPDDEPLVMVRVENSTPEPDGSTKTYFLRVNPECRPLLEDGTMGEPQKMTARNAVASVHGLRGEEYAPAIET